MMSSTGRVALLLAQGILAVLGYRTEHLCFASGDVVCPPVWQPWGREESCYTLTTHRLMWSDAGERCRQMGGEMMAPRSQEENDFVWSLVKDARPHAIQEGSPNADTWINCYENNHTQLLCGVEGGSKQMYQNWKFGEPNHGQADCVRMVPSSGKWADTFCSELHFAVCKRDSVSIGLSFQLQSWRILAACLKDHVIHEFQINSINFCAIECSSEPGCVSFNVLHQQGRKKICQLNNATRSNVDQGEFVKMTKPLCIYGEQ